ncbi:phage tail assembly protein [Dickeya sp. NCPPB 3274]|uniref:phage tail assembly protein n=1 Tax=Dickeya sp. NCPPB 3274 TaxID=568766 RepID=UPI0003A16064|nr:phage tail assembly protein [Dickeya sp. NCPPB 3274]
MTVETTSQNNVIILNAPIKRGETLIDAITLLTPTAGTLRGIGLAALASADVEALIKLLPRITYPALTEADVMGLELPDLLEFAGKVIGFLSPGSVR